MPADKMELHPELRWPVRRIDLCEPHIVHEHDLAQSGRWRAPRRVAEW